MKAPVVHGWVKADLAKLRAAGVVPNDDEIAWLARMAERAHEAPGGRQAYHDALSPLDFCGVRFWPLTLKASTWFARWFPVFDGRTELCVGIQLYAHAHSKPGNATLDAASDADAVARVVADWYSELPIRPDQLADLQARLVAMTRDSETVPNPDATPTTVADGASLEDRIAALCALYEGTTPDYWLDRVPAGFAYVLAAAKQARENGDAWATSPARNKLVHDYMHAVKWVARRGMGLEV